jgi:hypothetical protein
MAALGQPLPVGVLRSRQLNAQKPPVKERNVKLTEVPLQAADRRLAGEGQHLAKKTTNKSNRMEINDGHKWQLPVRTNSLSH